MLKKLFESIKNSTADYPSVLMSKDSWQEVIAEIELLQIENAELKKRPLFDTGTVYGREQMVIAELRAKGF